MPGGEPMPGGKLMPGGEAHALVGSLCLVMLVLAGTKRPTPNPKSPQRSNFLGT